MRKIKIDIDTFIPMFSLPFWNKRKCKIHETEQSNMRRYTMYTGLTYVLNI